MQEGAGESFSFEECRQRKQTLVRNTALEELKKIEDRLLILNQAPVEEIGIETGSTVFAETATDDYELNEELSSRFPVAVRTSQTLYECLVYALASNLYSVRAEKKRTKLLELKTILYTDELEDLCLGIEDVPEAYSGVATSEHLKEVLAKFFRLIERELQQPNIYSADTVVLQVLNKFPVFLFAFVLLLRKLVKRLSLLYEMEIEDYSVYEMRTDPELDILWLLGEFFEVSFVMYQLDSKIIKEQKFKVNEQEPICLVRNDDPSSDWTYLCLRDHRVREMSDIQAEDRPPNENFWKTNSSASELKIITYFDRMPQQLPEMKTKRKVPRRLQKRKYEKSSQVRQEFSYDFKAISAETEYVISMGESALARLRRLAEQPAERLLGIERTVEVKLVRMHP